jgi:crotonobetainyl-CoA:carnitine CoA-transferase CaiB-like acyl-CoA transferase
MKPHQNRLIFLSANRGKQSITIDIRQQKGQAIIHQLIESCDVLI